MGDSPLPASRVRVQTRGGGGDVGGAGSKSPIPPPDSGYLTAHRAAPTLGLQLDAKEPRVEGEPNFEPRSLRATQPRSLLPVL